jgi:hypothetical protein
VRSIPKHGTTLTAAAKAAMMKLLIDASSLGVGFLAMPNAAPRKIEWLPDRPFTRKL